MWPDFKKVEELDEKFIFNLITKENKTKKEIIYQLKLYDAFDNEEKTYDDFMKKLKDYKRLK